MKTIHMISYLLSFFLLTACNNANKQSLPSSDQKVELTNNNFLTMKINGKEWTADHDVFGAFHPKGHDQAIIIAGATGNKDKTEKTFNINIYKTSGPGEYIFAQGNTALSVVQMGNWSDQDYICGSMMGFDMKVMVTKASNNPDVVEATFSGTLTCPSGPALVITDGKFSYHE